MPTPDEELERAKLEALAEFAAGAGHEMNNPLAVISGRAQMLLRDEQNPERRRELGIIRAQALRVHEMIADMMLFARPPLPERARCDLSAVVDAAIAALRPKAQLLRIELSRDDDPAACEAVVDATQIQMALRAVIDNGLNALRPEGCVEVELREVDADWAEIEVRDDGPGIPAAVREHLFDPFFSGREAGRGLGMGLAKAWRIVTNHGGTIRVATSPESGATFVLRIPRSL
jgi:signal transduction histidine kinase